MVSTPTPKTEPATPVSPRLALLESLITIVLGHVNAEFTGMASRIALVLLDPEEAGGDDKALYQRFKSGNQIRKDSYAFLHLYTKALERLMREEMAKLAPPPGKARGAVKLKAQALSLVPYEEMDEQVAFGALSQPFDVRYAEELATLNLRLASMLERDSVRGTQNPFRPEVFLSALQTAWNGFEQDAEAHGLLLPVCKPDLCFDFAPMYAALSRALVKKGARPESEEATTLRKGETHDATLKSAARAQALLTEQLRNYFSSVEGQGVAAAARAATEQAQLARPNADVAFPSAPMAQPGWHPATAMGAPPAGVPQPAWQPSTTQAVPPSAQQVFHPQTTFASPVPAGMAAFASPVLAGTAAAGFAGTASSVAAGVNGDAVHSAPPFPSQGGAAMSPDVEQAMRSLMREPLMAFLAQWQPSAPMATPSAPSLRTSAPGRFHDAAAEALPIPAEALYLPRIKASAPKGSLTRTDEHTIDLLSSVFDTVFADTSITREIRQMMGLLQIPVLKAALSDKEFFFEQAHPARRLIDLLARMGWEQRKGPDDPLFDAMQRSVERVGRDFEQETSVFADAVAELEATMQAQEQQATQAIAAPIASALKQEKRAEAVRAAQLSVAQRVDSGALIALLENFLEKKWVDVLTVAHDIEDSKPGAVRNATATMDELIWSVQPKLTQDERKRFIRKLPPLLAALNRWLDVIAWQDADRLQFFAELAECHASIVRAPLDLTPERQLEIAVAVAQQAAERRLARQAVAAPVAAPLVDEAVDTVASLQRGMWLEFDQPDGVANKVKLAWISPKRTLFIFATSARQEAHSMPADDLAARLRQGQVRVVNADGLVNRALEQAMAQAMRAASSAGAAPVQPDSGFDTCLELPHLRTEAV